MLGIEVLRNWDAGTITLCHERKAVAVCALGHGEYKFVDNMR